MENLSGLSQLCSTFRIPDLGSLRWAQSHEEKPVSSFKWRSSAAGAVGAGHRGPGRGLLLNPTRFPTFSPPIFSVLAQRSSYIVCISTSHPIISSHSHSYHSNLSINNPSIKGHNECIRPDLAARRGDSAPKPEPDTANHPPLPSPRPSQSILAPDKRQLRDTSLCRVSSLPAPSNRALRS